MLKSKISNKPVTTGEFRLFKSQVNRGFKNVKKTLDQHTRALISIENTVKFYGDIHKINKDEIGCLDKRVTAIEAR